MDASDKKVVYAFSIFEKRLFCIYCMKNLNQDGSKYSIFIHPNHNSLSPLGKLSKTFSKIDV